ncbi:hypothetical protein QBC42DRAFT_253955 [Cladorrhinum samala]|uniref:Uncharacterized protein n=1 Tax=Cladorrhinum samala TaxID=585594 RepID=A0AAV9HLJ6_9PEZI|nr:hypothetical protein QBC42DRAFT_253955 [Cladorrhinum samala]
MFLSPVGLKFGITDVFKVKVPSPAFLSEFKGQERQVMFSLFRKSRAINFPNPKLRLSKSKIGERFGRVENAEKQGNTIGKWRGSGEKNHKRGNYVALGGFSPDYARTSRLPALADPYALALAPEAAGDGLFQPPALPRLQPPQAAYRPLVRETHSVFRSNPSNSSSYVFEYEWTDRLQHNGLVSQTKVTHQNCYDYPNATQIAGVARMLPGIPNSGDPQPPPDLPPGPRPALPPPPGPAGPAPPAAAAKAPRADGAAPALKPEASSASKERDRLLKGLQEFGRQQRELMAAAKNRNQPPGADNAGPPRHREREAERRR